MVRTGTRGGPGVPQADGFDGYGDHYVRGCGRGRLHSSIRSRGSHSNPTMRRAAAR